MSDETTEVERLRAEVAFLKGREEHFARALSVTDGGRYRADWPGAMERCIRDRDDAQAAHARLVRAIADRKGALESVTPERVRAYLAGHGWTVTRALGPPLTGFPLELWACSSCIEAHVLTTTEAADYAECMGQVARKCAAAEGRDIAFVIADWLAEESTP